MQKKKKKKFLLICIILNWKDNDRSEKAIFNRSRMNNSHVDFFRMTKQ